MTNFVRKTHTIGDVVWNNLGKILQDKVIDYKTKFHKFEIIVKCIAGCENIKKYLLVIMREVLV